jgi:hypothetical protein
VRRLGNSQSVEVDRFLLLGAVTVRVNAGRADDADIDGERAVQDVRPTVDVEQFNVAISGEMPGRPAAIARYKADNCPCGKQNASTSSVARKADIFGIRPQCGPTTRRTNPG